MTTITISSKNQVVIPKEVRTAMHLSGGDSLVVAEVTADHVVLKKQPSYHDLMGILEPGEGDPVLRIRKLRDNWRSSDS